MHHFSYNSKDASPRQWSGLEGSGNAKKNVTTTRCKRQGRLQRTKTYDSPNFYLQVFFDFSNSKDALVNLTLAIAKML